MLPHNKHQHLDYPRTRLGLLTIPLYSLIISTIPLLNIPEMLFLCFRTIVLTMLSAETDTLPFYNTKLSGSGFPRKIHDKMLH